MKRFEYYIMSRLIVKADDRAEADLACQRSGAWRDLSLRDELGYAVVESEWWSLPGESVIEFLPEKNPLPKTSAVLKPLIPPKTKPPGSLIDQLKRYQLSQGKSIPALAKMLGISDSTVYQWFNHKWNPSSRMIEKIHQLIK